VQRASPPRARRRDRTRPRDPPARLGSPDRPAAQGPAIAVTRSKAAGQDWLDPGELADYRAAYQQIITLGRHTNPTRTIPTGKRGVIRQTPAHNLLGRLDRDREHVLRFAHDYRVRSTTTSPNATSA